MSKSMKFQFPIKIKSIRRQRIQSKFFSRGIYRCSKQNGRPHSIWMLWFENFLNRKTAFPPIKYLLKRMLQCKRAQMKLCLPHMWVGFRLWFLEWILGCSRITLQTPTGCCCTSSGVSCSTNIRQIHLVFIISILLFAMTYTFAFRARWTYGFACCRFHKIVISATGHRAGISRRNKSSRWIFDACAQMRIDILFGQRSQCFWCWFAVIFRCDTVQMSVEMNKKKIAPGKWNAFQQKENSLRTYWIMSPHSIMPMCSLAGIKRHRN